MRLRRQGTNEDPVIEFSDIEEIAKVGEGINGRFSIPFNGIPVDFLYENRNHDVTVVAFHGAVQTNVDLPYHIGAGVMKNVEANRLSISDPSLTLGNELKLGWFGGSRVQLGLQKFIGEVINKVSYHNNVVNLIFFGASGGGFGALEMSARFPGSLAVPMNPQTSITRYHPPAVDLYVDTAWDGVSPFDEEQNLLIHNLVDSYPKDPINTIAYIQNTRDKVHIRNQQLPFYQKVGSSNRVWELMGSWGSPKYTGHTPPPKELVEEVLTVLAVSNGLWEIGLRKLEFTKVNSRK